MGRLSLSSLECSCAYGVKNGHIAAGWVDECSSELEAPVATRWSDIEKHFCGDIRMLLGVNGEKRGHGVGWEWW